MIYDLEKKVLVENGLADVPYSGIVEGYFNTDELSNELREKFDKYKKLANKSTLDADDYEKIANLEMYLEEIPDYLALPLTTEYQELKAKLRATLGSVRASSKGYIVRWVEAPSNKLLTTAFEASLESVSTTLQTKRRQQDNRDSY